MNVRGKRKIGRRFLAVALSVCMLFATQPDLWDGVMVQAAEKVENDTDAIIQTLSDRIAALPDTEEYLALEPDMEEDEDAYAEWEEKLYEYAEEARAIWEEYEALTGEQQAQISEEELARLTAWLEIAEMLTESSQVMATSDANHTHCICSRNEDVGDHINHTNIEYKMLTTNGSGQLLIDGVSQDNYTLTTGNYYLPEPDNPGDKTEIEIGTITISGDVTLCLNGGTLKHSGETGSVIEVSRGSTFTLCDCKSDTGCITGGKGHVEGDVRYGGGIYMYPGTTFNMFGGVIKENTCAGGGAGINCAGTRDDPNSEINIYGGKIINNLCITGMGGGMSAGYAQVKIFGGTIEGNTARRGGGINLNNSNIEISNASIINNTITDADYGGGVFGTQCKVFSISGTVNISGNKDGNSEASNVFFRSGLFFDVTDNLGGSSIGITVQRPPTSAKPNPVQVAGGKEYGITPADWSCFFSDKDDYEILRKETTDNSGKSLNELWLALPGSCDLGGLDLSASGATLSPSPFDPDTTRYTSEVANSVDQVGITATLASTASGANITIKINDGAETSMDSGVKKTVNLDEGENTIVITVTSGEMSKAYTIKITREEAPAGFTVTLNGNGGSAGTDLTSYDYGTGATLPTDWTRTGYTFSGWYDNENCTGTKVENISATDTEDKEYWAKWTPISYTISYDGNGSTGGSTANSSHTYDTAEALTANSFTRSCTVTFNPNYTGSNSTDKTAAYTFAGWNMKADGSGTSYDDNASVKNLTETNNGTITLYAQWTPTLVTYTPTRAGYTFAGWYAEASCTGSRVDSDGTYTPTGSMITLYAKWAPKSYDVTLNTNGGTGGTDITSYTCGTVTTLPTDWTKTGYDFAGWYANENYTGDPVTEISATDTGEKKYWAKWTPTSYNISYDLDGGAVTGNPTSYTIEDSAITLINPTKTGYSFGGWSGTDLTGSNNMSVTIAAGSTGDREYKAHWNVADYTVTLNGNGGQGGTSLISYAHGTGATLPTDWTRAGYSFAGWYDNENCTGTEVTEIPATAMGNKEYWAKWTPISYTITYLLDGGTVTGNPASYTIEDSAITLNNPTREGYTFTGWGGTDLTGNNHMSVTIASGSTGNRTYTAYWEVKGYTVTLHKNGGTGGTDLTSYTFGMGAAFPTDWTKKGYVFDGWYDNADCSGAEVKEISATATGNKEYWAKWTDNIAPVIGMLSYNYQPKSFWQWLIGKKSLIITVPVTEEGSGADKITYTVTPDGGTAKVETATIQNGEAEITVSKNFKGTISIVCTDQAGNTSTSVTVGTNGIIIEDKAPNISFKAENAESLSSGEYKTVPDIVVTVADDKDNAISGGIASVSYQINGGSEKTVAHDYTTGIVESDSFTISADEITASGIPADGVVISVTATDNAGNSRTATHTVKIHTHSVKQSVPEKEATCTAGGNKAYVVCSCGKYFSDSTFTAEMTEQEIIKEAKGHDFAGKHIFDKDNHWQKCSQCPETAEKEAHKFGTDSTHCTVCDYEKAGEGHIHSGELQNAIEPTCTEKGNTAYYTCACGSWFTDSACTDEIADHSKIEIKAWGHDFAMKQDQSEHWQECSRCHLEQSRGEHIYDNDSDTDCNECGYERTVEHTHSGIFAAAKPATCTEDGNKEYYQCSCGKYFSDSACTSERTEQDVVIRAKGHTEVTDAAKAATCTQTGLTEGSHCSVCSQTITAQTVTTAKGHDFSGAYEKDEKYHWKTCTRCDETEPKAEHIYDNDTDRDCNACGYQRNINPAGETGTVSKEVEKDEKAPDTTLSTSKEELADIILTEDEKAQIENGTDIKFILDVKDAGDTVSSSDKAAVQETLSGDTGARGFAVGQYLDISLFKIVGENRSAISQTARKLTIVIDVPDSLRSKDSARPRTYAIVRVHDGTAEVLEDLDQDADTVTIATDRFSAYALVYHEAGGGADVTPTPTPGGSDKPTEAPGGSDTPSPTPGGNDKPSPTPGGEDNVTPTPSPAEKPQKASGKEKRTAELHSGLKAVQTGKKLQISWGRVSGADGYSVYVQYCGKDFNAKSLNQVKSGKKTKITVKKVNGKKLDTTKNFKLYVVAWKWKNGKKSTLAKTLTVHIAGKDSAEYTNVKNIKLKKTSYTLKKGGTVTLRPKAVLYDKKKKQLSVNHTKEFRYLSSNKKVAVVTAGGKVKAKGPGSCTIYVFAKNGCKRKIKIKVKK